MTDIETSYETGGQDRNYYICTTADPVDIPLLLLPHHIFLNLSQTNITQIEILQTTNTSIRFH